jgi:hypothetical protein
MIISHSRRFIFVKTYKTAGSSLEIALSKYCGPEDILTPLDEGEEAERRARSGLGARNYGKPARRYRAEDIARLLGRRQRAERFREHSAAWQIRRMIGREIWESYFTFAVVRNPYDRCLSRFYYTKKFEEERRAKAWDLGSLDQFMRYNPGMINENWAMYTQNDEVLVDFLVRYEHLEADLAEASRRIGLERNLYEDMREVSAKRGLRPSADKPSVQLSEAGRQMIALLCAPEIALFGYTPDGSAPAPDRALRPVPGPAPALAPALSQP